MKPQTTLQMNFLTRDFFPQFLNVLRDIEVNGMAVDLEHLTLLEQNYPAAIRKVMSKIKAHPDIVAFVAQKCQREDFEFNIFSNQQRSEFLFRFLKLRPVKQTESALKAEKARDKAKLKFMEESGKRYSVDAEVMQRLRGTHETVEWFSDLTEMRDIFTRYVYRIRNQPADWKKDNDEPPYLGRDGLLHPRCRPNGTATGRISVADPPLQQIPNNTDVKKLFISRFPEGRLVIGDMSQIELRVIAMLADERGMIAAFERGEDIHRVTALSIFGNRYAELEQEIERTQDAELKSKLKGWRTIAKAVNFGNIYEQSAAGLANTLSGEGIPTSQEQAEEYQAGLNRAFPRIAQWKKTTQDFVAKNGFVISPFGRVRHLDGVFGNERWMVSEALRQGVNAPIQATASDLTACAMISLSQMMEGMKSKLIMMIHDSIIVDSPPEEVEYMARLMGDVMNSVDKILPSLYPQMDWSWLTCPLRADIEVGKNWAEMKATP